MHRLIRFALLGIVVALLVCVAVFTLGRTASSRRAPTAQPARSADAAPTRSPAPRQPTALPRGYVSKALLGDTWPLRIDEGTIVCDRTAILLRAPDGHLYAVNGTARSQVGHFGWRDIRDITLPDPSIKGLIMSVQPIIDQGLDMCR